MSTNLTCRFALHVGLSTISFVKIESGARWRLVSSGLVEAPNISTNPEEARQALHSILQQLVKQAGIGREPIHISLHNRMCITRVVTGSRQQVDAQLAEITENSQHYLQLGLGEKLIGHSTVTIDESRQHGQVAIIKRGVMETIDGATSQAGLQLASVDGALTCVSRVAGIAGIDRSPLLVVWLGSSGAEIGISYKGRLQLNYHSGECVDLQSTVLTIGKHLKRLRRFCDRYRQVDGKSDLRQVLVLAKSRQDQALKAAFKQYDFEQVYSLDDLNSTSLATHLGGQQLCSAGAVSALGGLLVHLDSDALPTTDVYRKYLASKPRSLWRIVCGDGWPLLASAAMLLCMLCGNWILAWKVQQGEIQTAAVAGSFDFERQQLLELDDLRKVLREYHRLANQTSQPAVRDVVTRVAQCLPAECRLDWCGFDSLSALVLKGTMLQGDQTYEILKALRDLPEISEVALESVGNSSSQGRTAIMFEIHCELARQPATSNMAMTAGRTTAGQNAFPRGHAW